MKKVEIGVIALLNAIAVVLIIIGAKTSHFDFFIWGLMLATVSFVYVAIKEIVALEKDSKQKDLICADLIKRMRVCDGTWYIECTSSAEVTRIFDLFSKDAIRMYDSTKVYLNIIHILKRNLK